jgi:flavorubredoxin
MKVLVVYESTRGRTKAMADAICEGVKAAGATCEVLEAKSFGGMSDVCALAVGSSTRMKRPLPKVKQILGELPDLGGKPAAAFGSYGWSGEAPDEIAKSLSDHGGKIEGQPIRAKDFPSETVLEQCRELGNKLAASC